MAISSLPTPPSRQDPINFNDRADAFLGALPTFQTEANALQVDVNTKSDNVTASYNAVMAATNITKWVSGTTYANGAVVWSPINGLAYRRITASGSGTTDPSLDTTNYKQVNGTGDVSTSGNQTIAGTKTFSGDISATTITGKHIGDGAEQAGMVGFFARNTAPTGWLQANGAAVNRTTYATLFAAIGTTFGVGDGSTTFNLPDLRGEFIRGWDDGRGIDSGRAFGSLQQHQLAYHMHRIPWGEGNAGQWGQTNSAGKKGSGSTDNDDFWYNTNDGGDYDGVVNAAGLLGNETRPRNLAMLGCIKY